jgi:prepilin-type N-terminal cleavage/methylation domain-containing protein
MKNPPGKDSGPPDRQRHGFTLIEIQITMLIFSMVVLAVVYVNMIGLKLDQLTNSKLGASDDTRRTMGLMSKEMRSATGFAIGNGTGGSTFTQIPGGTTQRGNSLRIYTSQDNSRYVDYFFQAMTLPSGQIEGQLRRRYVADTTSTVVAKYLTTNSMFFQEEGFDGTVKTGYDYKSLVHVTLDFYQFQFPMTRVGTGYYYDEYMVDYRLTPHVPRR